ncbi:MAG: hypothetical protein OXG24_03910 [Gammaproteobacteria bacterium]|nr:hypothetical protein [Gammaproteobacteria bacterium]
MSESNLTSSVVKIGIIFAVLGGVFGLLESVTVIFYALHLVMLSNSLGVALHGIAGLLGLVLSSLLIWRGIQALISAERKYGWMVIVYSSLAVGLSALVVALDLFLTHQSINNSEFANTITHTTSWASVSVWHDIPKYLSLGIIGGVLMVFGVARKP